MEVRVPGFLHPRGLFLVAAVCVTAWSATASSVETARAERPTAGAGPSVVAYAPDVSSPLPPAVYASGPSALLADDTLPPVTTASGADDLWHSAPVTVIFTATDAGGEVAYTEYSLDGGDWTRGTQLAVTAPADHSGDGIHILLFRSADLAGTVEDPPGSVTVKIDTTAPVTSAAGVTSGAWFAVPATVALSAADEASGVAYTEYSLDGSDWLRGGEVVLPAPADHSRDGIHTLLFRSADEAGNFEQTQALTAGTDTVNPTTRAPSAVSVMRYRTASLPYRVLDPAPNGGTADVTIRIRDRSGRVVKTLTYRGRPVGTALSARFTCSLPRGSYRFFVYARDAAGNRQATAAGNRLTVTAPWSLGLPFRFRVIGLKLIEKASSGYPLLRTGSLLPRIDTEPHDAQGVRMFWYGGRLYNHVVAQARYGLQNLDSYASSRDRFYLLRAEAQAQRLIARRDLVGSAWFHPYDFAFAAMSPPWYSGMGQGLCLALFSGLYDTTGKDVYRQAAKGTFESFLRRGPSPSPWVVNVDGSGYLWLQEYPASSPDYTLNGHIYAAQGLYHYFRIMRDRRALELFNGAATTVLRYASSFRRPGWMSYYCLAHHQSAGEKYHLIHVHQFQTFYRLTGLTTFIRLADTFLHDYPRPEVRGRIRVAPGTYTGLRFDSSGRAVDRRTWRVTAAVRLPVTRRERILNQPGYWFATTSGPWAGYHLRERAGTVYLPGTLHFLGYNPARVLVLPAGHAYVGHRYADDGRVTASLRLSPATATRATADERAIVNGVEQVHVASGALRGYWLRLRPALLR